MAVVGIEEEDASMKRRYVVPIAAGLLVVVFLVFLPSQSLAASTVVDLNAASATAAEQSRKVFKNPRGMNNYYVFYLDDVDNFIRYANSSDGVTWTSGKDASGRALELTTSDNTSWATTIYDDGTQLHVYLAYANDNNGRLRYRHGTIADGATAITWATEEGFGAFATDAYGVSLALASNGRLFLAWSDESTPGSEALRVFGWDVTPAGDGISGDHNATTEGSRLITTANPTGVADEVNVVYQESTTILNGVTVFWNGTVPTFGTKSEVTGLGLARAKISAATDTQATPETHVAYRNGSAVEHRTYTNASGFDASTTVLAAMPDSVSLAIDETSTPDKAFVFYVKNGVAGDLFFKTSPVDTISFGSEQTINDGTESIDYLSAAEKDWGADSKIPIAYTIQTTFRVRFHEAEEPAAGCQALTVVTSDPAGQLFFNGTTDTPSGGLWQEVNVSASFQNATTPGLNVTNDGTGTCDITLRLMSDPGMGRSMKFNTTDSAPWPSDTTREVPLDPSAVTVCTGVTPGGTCDIWLWVDFENALGGQLVVSLRVESV